MAQGNTGIGVMRFVCFIIHEHKIKQQFTKNIKIIIFMAAEFAKMKLFAA